MIPQEERISTWTASSPFEEQKVVKVRLSRKSREEVSASAGGLRGPLAPELRVPAGLDPLQS